MPTLQTVAKSRLGRHTVGTSATFIWHAINSTREHQRAKLAHEKISEYDNRLSFEKKLKKGEEFEFDWTGAECTTQDFENPQTESERFVIFNLLTPLEDVLDQHQKLWEKLWEGDIVIKENLGPIGYSSGTIPPLYLFSRGFRFKHCTNGALFPKLQRPNFPGHGIVDVPSSTGMLQVLFGFGGLDITEEDII